MLYELCNDMIREGLFKVNNKDNYIFNVPASDKWWTRYTTQEVIIFDDFARVNPTEVTESDCSRLSGLKGSTPFDVPKPFEDKGVLAVPKLIACASNYPYPTANGIKDKVVWSRRNSLWTVASDTSVYKTCSIHDRFFFQNTCCVGVNEAEIFENYPHLKFTEMKPSIPNETIFCVAGTSTLNPNVPLNYTQFKERLLQVAREYYRIKDMDYEKRKEQAKEFSGDPRWSNNLIPKEISDDFSALLNESDFDDAVRESGIDVVQPAMVLNKMFAWGSEKISEWKKVTPQNGIELKEVEAECGHYLVYKHLLNPVPNDKESKWFVRGKWLQDQPCTSKCVWSTYRAIYWHTIYEKCKGTNLPECFPSEFNPQLLQNLEGEIELIRDKFKRKPWYVNSKKILATIGCGIMVCVGAALFHTYAKSDGNTLTELIEVQSIPTAEGDFTLSSKMQKKKSEWATKHIDEDVQAALETSGSIATRFKQVLKLGNFRPKQVPQGTKPAVFDEMSALKNTYMYSVVELSANGGKAVARCVQISSEKYLTQVHSMCTILKYVSGEILKVFKAKTYCTTKCGKEHSQECVNRTGNTCQLVFTRLGTNGETRKITMRMKDFIAENGGTLAVDTQGSDMIGFVLRRSDFNGKSIEKYLASEVDYRVDMQNVGFYDPGTLDRDTILPYDHTTSAVTCHETITYTADQTAAWAPKAGEVEVVLKGWKINSPVKGRFKSSCGSILIDNTTCKIIGLLSAASNTSIYFNILTKELVADEFNFYTDTLTTDSEGRELHVEMNKNAHVEVPETIATGSLKEETQQAMRVYQTVKTQIVPSICYEQFGEAKRFPANLSQGNDKGDRAFLNGIKNYVPHKNFNLLIVEEARQDLEGLFMANCHPLIPVCSKRPIKESISGVLGHIPGITMSTSPGIPWVCNSKTKRKSDLITFDEDHQAKTINQQLMRQILEEEKKMELGVKPVTIFHVTLKDERLIPEKRDNVRLIQGSPLQLTISARSYLMDFNYAFQLNRQDLQHCVGINPESSEWDDLARKLLKKGNNICVGDYSKFGPRLNNSLVEASYEIMNSWYQNFGFPEPQHQVARRTLGKRVVNSLNLFSNKLYQVQCGSPSGAMNTVVVNSMCNMLYMRIAWMGIMRARKPSLSGLHHFAELVEFFCYGDDVIFSVSDSVIDDFNNETICEFFANYNFKYTDVTKDGKMRKYCRLEEATFLKRGFKLFKETPAPGGVWICVPNLEDALDTTNWVRKPKGLKTGCNNERTLLDAAIENCEDCIRKSWFHGRDTFLSTQSKIRQYFRDIGSKRMPTYYTFEGLQSDYDIPLYDTEDTTPAMQDSSMVGIDNENSPVCYCWSKPETDVFEEHKCSHKAKSLRISQYGVVTDRNATSNDVAQGSTNRQEQSQKCNKQMDVDIDTNINILRVLALKG
jgi:hypothetical protein